MCKVFPHVPAMVDRDPRFGRRSMPRCPVATSRRRPHRGGEIATRPLFGLARPTRKPPTHTHEGSSRPDRLQEMMGTSASGRTRKTLMWGAVRNVETPLFKMWRAPTCPEYRQVGCGG